MNEWDIIIFVSKNNNWVFPQRKEINSTPISFPWTPWFDAGLVFTVTTRLVYPVCVDPTRLIQQNKWSVSYTLIPKSFIYIQLGKHIDYRFFIHFLEFTGFNCASTSIKWIWSLKIAKTVHMPINKLLVRFFLNHASK